MIVAECVNICVREKIIVRKWYLLQDMMKSLLKKKGISFFNLRSSSCTFLPASRTSARSDLRALAAALISETSSAASLVAALEAEVSAADLVAAASAEAEAVRVGREVCNNNLK